MWREEGDLRSPSPRTPIEPLSLSLYQLNRPAEMWQAALQDPQERSAFQDLLEGYFRRPFPTSPPSAAAPAPPPALATRAPVAPSHSSYSAPAPRQAPASPSSGPRQPAGLVQEQREDPMARVTSSPHYQAYKLSQAKTPTEAVRTIGGMDASTKRAVRPPSPLPSSPSPLAAHAPTSPPCSSPKPSSRPRARSTARSSARRRRAGPGPSPSPSRAPTPARRRRDERARDPAPRWAHRRRRRKSA